MPANPVCAIVNEGRRGAKFDRQTADGAQQPIPSEQGVLDQIADQRIAPVDANIAVPKNPFLINSFRSITQIVKVKAKVGKV